MQASSKNANHGLWLGPAVQGEQAKASGLPIRVGKDWGDKGGAIKQSSSKDSVMNGCQLWRQDSTGEVNCAPL